MRAIAVAVPIAVVALVAAYALWPAKSASKHDADAKGSQAAVTPSAPSAPEGVAPAYTFTATVAPSAPTNDRVKQIAFGDGPGALGRGTTADGKPIAPASFIAGPDGLVILDQEHSRILRADGTSIPLPGKHADDIAPMKDGSLAVLDRKGAKEVTLVDRNGHVFGHLPLNGSGVDDPSDVSRMFVSDGEVLVEQNGGGPLLRLGGTDGSAGDRTQIEGIPTRDGSSLVSAGITSEDDGRAWITLADREAVHRWTRELRYGSALSAVGFLDSESNGTIWAVFLAGSSQADYVNWAVCLDPATGAIRASFTLAVENPPWESYRDFAVQDGAGLVTAMRSDSGVSYTTYPCH